METSSTFDDKPTVLEGSTLSLRSELDSFSIPETNVSQLNTNDYVPFFPILSVREPNNPIEFVINVGSNCYLDLADSWLSITARIKKADGTSCVKTTDTVAPGNVFFQTMFQNLSVYINGKLVYDSANCYAHDAYINRVLTMPASLKNSKLRNELF